MMYDDKPLPHNTDWIALGHYWLHVHADGTGERYAMTENERGAPWLAAQLRSIPALAIRLVVVDGIAFEETTTTNARGGKELWTAWTCVRPRGDGWVMYDHSSDHWTTWRREWQP